MLYLLPIVSRVTWESSWSFRGLFLNPWWCSLLGKVSPMLRHAICVSQMLRLAVPLVRTWTFPYFMWLLWIVLLVAPVFAFFWPSQGILLHSHLALVFSQGSVELLLRVLELFLWSTFFSHVLPWMSNSGWFISVSCRKWDSSVLYVGPCPVVVRLLLGINPELS